MDLDGLAADVAQRLGVVGAQVAVARGAQVTIGVTGLATAHSGARVVPETLFQIGSSTKLYTAVLAMQLVQEGLLGLDDPVSEQLPGFRLGSDHATRTVTPRHLMSMSSGIDNGPYVYADRGDDALANYVAALSDLPMTFDPGEAFGYSNASTCVTGRLVEHLTGSTWESALFERLLEPAGLVESAVHAEDVIARPHATGHVLSQGEVRPVARWSFGRAMGPTGLLSCTAADLARFGRLFCHAGTALNGGAILRPATIALMGERVTPVPPTLVAEWWGLGPYGKVWDGVEVMGHSGTNLSGSSYVLWSAKKDLVVATTVNTPALGYPFAAQVFAELFRSEAAVEVPTAITPPDAVEVDHEALVGDYAMSGTTMSVRVDGQGLRLEVTSTSPGIESEVNCRLIPLTDRTFLPSDPAVDGGRGWALAFEGPADAPATRLVNGFFALRRV